MRGKCRLLLDLLVIASGLCCTTRNTTISGVSPDTLGLQQVIANVRRATGIEAINDRTNSFEFEGITTTDGPSFLQKQPRPERLRFTLDGRFRREFLMDACLPTVLAYDGNSLWMHNVTSGPDRFDDPLVLIAHWIMTGAWLARIDDLSLGLLHSECTRDDIIASIGLKGSPSVGWITIDRGTWLPRALCRPHHPESPEWEFADYRSEPGFSLPYNVTIYPRKENSLFIQSYKCAIVFDKIRRAGSGDQGSYDAPGATVLGSFQANESPDVACKVIHTGHILVSASLDEAESRWFLLDTGAEGLVIDTTEADRSGLEWVFKVQQAAHDKPTQRGWVRCMFLRVGPLQIENSILATTNFTPFQSYLNNEAIGILGYDLFASAVVELDASKSAVRLFRSDQYPGQALRWYPLRFSAKLPFIRCRVNGVRDADFLIDTGSNGSISLRDEAIERFGISREAIPDSRSATLQDNTKLTITTVKQRPRLDGFDIAGHHMMNTEFSVDRKKPPYAGVDFAGSIGMEILSQFKVVFDYPNQRIALVKHPAAHAGEAKKE